MVTLRQLLAVGTSFAGLTSPRQAFRYSLLPDQTADATPTPAGAATPSDSPEAQPTAHPPGPVRSLKGLPVRSEPVRRRGNVARMLLALNPWLACRVDDRPQPASALSHVRVVRNDLSETDLEVAPSAIRTAAVKSAQRGASVRLSAVNIEPRSDSRLVVTT